MPTILPFDDFEPGKCITVHSRRPQLGRRIVRTEPSDGGEEEVRIQFEGSGGRIPQPGVPLQIVALNAPFVMVFEVHPGGVTKGPIYLDSRRVNLMAVPTAMVEALLALKPKHAATSVDDGSEDEEGLPF